MSAPPTGIPVPQIAAPDAAPPPQSPQQKLEAHIAAIDTALTAAQAADAATSDAASPAGDADLYRSISDQPDYPLPKLMAPPTTIQPATQGRGGGLLSTMTPREDQRFYAGANTVQLDRPPKTSDDWMLFYGAVIPTLGLLWWLSLRERNEFVRYWRLLVHTIRQRAALVICLGATLIAADRFIFAELDADRYWRTAHSAGWLAFFGACTMLIGIYHWITGPPTE